MKKFFYIVLIATILTSCEKIEGPYSENPKNNGNDTGAVRKVLLEDYTGQKCGNCPRAAEAIDAIKAIYGDKVIAIGVHVGYFATPDPQGSPKFTYDFRTPVGDYWDNEFGNGSIGLPNGMVNRKPINGNAVQGYNSWATSVAQILALPADATIKLTNSYNAANRQLSTTVDTDVLKDLSGNFKLCVYITEDSIVNWQKDYDLSPNDINNYTHRHVLRSTLNGNVGTAIGSGPLNSGDSFTGQYTITLDAGWAEKHCAIVAFLYNADTKEIIQAEEKKIMP